MEILWAILEFLEHCCVGFLEGECFNLGKFLDWMELSNCERFDLRFVFIEKEKERNNCPERQGFLFMRARQALISIPERSLSGVCHAGTRLFEF